MSVLKRVKFRFPGHGHGERPQRVKYTNRASMLGKDLRQPSVCHRAFVQITAGQKHPVNRLARVRWHGILRA